MPHYIAGGVGLMPLLAVQGLRWLRVSNRNYGHAMVLTLACLLVLQGASKARGHDHGQPWETGRQSPQMFAARELMKVAGQQLIFVRYAADHVDDADECVYNEANIDSSRIVWARDLGKAKDQELINYYRGGRKAWLYEPDLDPTKLVPFALAMN